MAAYTATLRTDWYVFDDYINEFGRWDCPVELAERLNDYITADPATVHILNEMVIGIAQRIEGKRIIRTMPESMAWFFVSAEEAQTMKFSPEYKQAIRTHNAAVAEFRKAIESYRSQDIDEQAFVNARNAYRKATAAYDKAYERERNQSR